MDEERMQALAQEWLTKRLEPLVPSDIEQDVHMYCTAPLEPPPQFRQMWTTFDGSAQSQPDLAPPEPGRLRAIIIFASPVEKDQVAALSRLVVALDAVTQDLPPMVWVPHTVAPEVDLGDGHMDAKEAVLNEANNNLCDLGIDGIVAGEPIGFRLALGIRSRVLKVEHLAHRTAKLVDRRHARARFADYLKQCIDIILWQYLRSRLAPMIPPVDTSLEPGELKHIAGYDIGPQLGHGAYGTVYKAFPRADTQQEETESVMKVVSKACIKECGHLQGLRRQLEVMQLLNSQEWRHPNLALFYSIYHSPTHLFLHMQFGGPENLFRRLRDRQNQTSTRPLPLPRCLSLIRQAITVLGHIHLGPKVCHRDIKPENFIVQDVPGTPLGLKLIDFDLAFVQKEGNMCRSSCGTIPFAAPEVMLAREYDGLAADVWSLGIVMLEVLCSVRIVDHVFGLNGVRSKDRPEKAISCRIRDGFSRPGALDEILQMGIRQELTPLLDVSRALLNGMLTVDPLSRLDSGGMLAGLSLFPPPTAEG